MKTFSIAELEQYTLIKAHTFRIWEKRYDIFTPQRRDSRFRFYSLDDLAFLLHFTLLNRLGYKVSLLAGFTKGEIEQKVQDLREDTAQQEYAINRLIVCTFSMRIEEFENVLDNAVAVWGYDQTVEEVIVPFLERMQLFSYKGRGGCEYHFVVTALRKKLLSATEQILTAESYVSSAVVFLPEGEHFDLLLLFVAYQLKRAGVNVLYLGTNVPAKSLKTMIEVKRPAFAVAYLFDNGTKKLNDDSPYGNVLGEIPFFIAVPPTIDVSDAPLKQSQRMHYRDIANALAAVEML